LELKVTVQDPFIFLVSNQFSKDILDHVNKLILGLIWTIILRFQICAPSGGEEGVKAPANIVEAKKGMIAWLESMGITGRLQDWYVLLTCCNFN
jgi:hypothetical protein